MAPSTPPPPASAEFAALAMASTGMQVMSPSWRTILRPVGLFHSIHLLQSFYDQAGITGGSRGGSGVYAPDPGQDANRQIADQRHHRRDRPLHGRGDRIRPSLWA